MQIHFWEKELYSVNKENLAGWDKLIREIKREEKVRDDGGEIREIKDHLMWGTVLQYF